MAFRLTSPTIENGKPIPAEHAKRGANLSPQLAWTDPPEGTRSFVLVMDDADAPSPAFRHWIVYDIPAQHRQLPRGRSSGAGVEGLPHGFNDFGNDHYDGPEPPEGDPPHTYRSGSRRSESRSLTLVSGLMRATSGTPPASTSWPKPS
jgi:Raf kinase inhibitor-like YbhB/YbcL family protein